MTERSHDKVVGLDEYRKSVPRRIKGRELVSENFEMVSDEDYTVYIEETEVKYTMDESTKMLIDRMDKDSREREERYHKDAQEREQRYRQDMQDQDRRFREDAKEREERILKAIEGNSGELKEIKAELAGTTKHVQSLVTANIWGLIATVVAIVALAVTIYFSLNP